MGVFGDWKGENLLSNIMFIYLIIMVVLMMFSPLLPRESYTVIMFVMFGGFIILIIITPISTFWIGYQKANTSVLEGWFDLEPGITEFTKIQIAEEVPVEKLSPKEKKDLKNFMDEYFKKFKEGVPVDDLSEEEIKYIEEGVPVDDLSEEEIKYIEQKEGDEEIVEVQEE